MKDFKGEMVSEFRIVKQEMREIEYRMTIKLGTVVVAAFSAFTLVFKFLGLNR